MPEAETTRTTMRPRAQAARRTAGCYSERCLDWPRRQPLDVSTYRVHQRCLHNVLACMCVADGGNMHRYLHIYTHYAPFDFSSPTLYVWVCRYAWAEKCALLTYSLSLSLIVSFLRLHFYARCLQPAPIHIHPHIS